MDLDLICQEAVLAELLPENNRCLYLAHYLGQPHLKFHYQSEYELVLTRGSVGKRVVGNSIKDYGNLDLVIIGPNLPHTWVHEIASEGCKMDNIVVHFTKESLGYELLNKPEMRNVLSLLNTAELGLEFSFRVAQEVEDKLQQMSQTSISWQLMLFLEVLIILSEQTEYNILVSPSYKLDKNNTLFSELLQFIHENHDKKIKLEDAASLLSMSIPTFTRFFRKMTDTSFIQYLNSWRIKRGCILLKETDYSVLEISTTVGFENLSNFNRQFLKVVGTTPRQYKDLNLQPGKNP
ncbi:MAG: helix-turn-helix domain-containing protein [Spirochaetales bacterium]|nr:helix-turn-helix domain-containing protein [Spirochaetales bacterium]